ncbi:MAG: hypothetical protein GY775_01090 [Candidatus Scalindua sp.]|nr:hypothetical protein [Candidatus Scalindua sp.]
MAFLIKDTKLKVLPRAILREEHKYIPFPTQDSVLIGHNALLPIGLLSYSQFDESSNEKILIAVPSLQGTFDGDYPFITYSLTSDGWLLDDEYSGALEYKLEENHTEYYQKAEAFFKQHNHLTCDLDVGDKSPLFELGGQPPLGQNWDSMLFDEMEDNPELDNYYDVMDEESGSDFENMSTKEITYFDEELEKEFIFLGAFSYDTYLDRDGDCIVFYQPELKKIMLVSEFS